VTQASQVEFFWKKRWSLAKVLFIWSRYYGLILNISDAVVFLQRYPSRNLCVRFLYWQAAAAAVQVLLTHVILALRLYAMYGNSRKILLFLVALIIAEFLCIVVGNVVGSHGIGSHTTVYTNEPLPGIFICAPGPKIHYRWAPFLYTAILPVESVFLWLALRKAWMQSPSVGGRTLMQRLTRDSVFYFILIFSVYIGNTIIWTFNHVILYELGTPFSFVLSSIFVNRLLIRIRSSYHRSTLDSDVDNYYPPIQFARAYTCTADCNTDIGPSHKCELEGFREKIGA